MSVLDPFSHVLAAVLASAHTGLASLGADPGAGTTWVLCIATLVIVVRVALLPLVALGVRRAHAAARARPRLADLLPVLVQLPIWIALYHLLSDVAAGVAVGAVTPHLAASLAAATLLGVPLAERGYLGAGWSHLAVVGGLAVVAALLSYATQRLLVAPNAVLTDVPEAIARTQQLMPTLSAAGLLVAGGAVPVALLVYWVCNSIWTLGQVAVIRRRFATPA